MGTYQAQRTVQWTTDQTYDLVADVERYPDFLPGWHKAKIIKSDKNQTEVEQTVGLGPFSIRFVSTAIFVPHEEIMIRSQAGPFSRLDFYWTFTPVGRGCCIKLTVNAKFRSYVLERTSGQFMESLVDRIIRAFERRARALYAG